MDRATSRRKITPLPSSTSSRRHDISVVALQSPTEAQTWVFDWNYSAGRLPFSTAAADRETSRPAVLSPELCPAPAGIMAHCTLTPGAAEVSPARSESIPRDPPAWGYGRALRSSQRAESSSFGEPSATATMTARAAQQRTRLAASGIRTAAPRGFLRWHGERLEAGLCLRMSRIVRRCVRRGRADTRP